MDTVDGPPPRGTHCSKLLSFLEGKGGPQRSPDELGPMAPFLPRVVWFNSQHVLVSQEARPGVLLRRV